MCARGKSRNSRYKLPSSSACTSVANPKRSTAKLGNSKPASKIWLPRTVRANRNSLPSFCQGAPQRRASRYRNICHATNVSMNPPRCSACNAVVVSSTSATTSRNNWKSSVPLSRCYATCGASAPAPAATGLSRASRRASRLNAASPGRDCWPRILW